MLNLNAGRFGPLPESWEAQPDGSYAERLARDGALTARIQDGYTEPTRTEENPSPRIIDGSLTPDAQLALSDLWEHYEPAARGIAGRLRGRIHSMPAVDADDLVQEGFFGLYHASLRWNPGKSTSFLTNARSSMYGYMLRYLGDTATTVRIPIHRREEVARARRRSWRLYQEREHFPGRQELANALGRSNGYVDSLRIDEAVSEQMGSIDGGYFEDERDGPSTFSAGEGRWKPIDPAASEQRELETDFLVREIGRMVNDAIAKGHEKGSLSERDLKVLRLRFLEGPRTLEEVGEEFGVTRERVRQIEAKLMAKMRSPNLSDALREHLES